MHGKRDSSRACRSSHSLSAAAGERGTHSWLMALSYTMRHSGVESGYLRKNLGHVMPVSPQDHDSGWKGSGAAGHKGEGFARALSAGGGQRLCCKQKDDIFLCSAIWGSEDQRKIFPNPF